MKIKSIKYIGLQDTYSPEMRSDGHNYITPNSYAVHKNSHAAAYCLMALRCLWMKAHFAPEWWASVMSTCHPDKLIRYMHVARAEEWLPTDITYSGIMPAPTIIPDRVSFDTINIENLTTNFSVTGDKINPGLLGIKGIGPALANKFAGAGTYADIDEFIAKKAPDKIMLERLIKLDAFKHLHPNSKALWNWYLYKYAKDSETKKFVISKLREQQGWNNQTIDDERKRQIAAYFKLYPKRKKIPRSLEIWLPTVDDSRDNVMALFPTDFNINERLEAQNLYLGYFIDSPLLRYKHKHLPISGVYKEIIANNNPTMSRDNNVYTLQGVVLEKKISTTKDSTEEDPKYYARVTITDGKDNAIVYAWNNLLTKKYGSGSYLTQVRKLKYADGVNMSVYWDKSKSMFIMNDILPLQLIENETDDE